VGLPWHLKDKERISTVVFCFSETVSFDNRVREAQVQIIDLC
jgi:hypothetical protein